MRGTRKSGMKKKLLALIMCLVLVISTFSTVGAFTGFTGEWTRLTRLSQPTSRHKFEANELGVVNFKPTYGDKAANIASMEDYIDEAHEKGVKILVFPEMCVTGYLSSSNPESDEYKWAVESAEPLDGPTQQTFAELSDEYDMWIIYGSTQEIAGDDEHAYNSAFACSPEGEVTAYQKITPVEGSWCVAGETPVLIDAGEYGKLGLSICYDTYSTPEIGRYYAAQGCNILINPTATGGGWSMTSDETHSYWEEYYKLRLESVASRDGMTILSSDLVGDNNGTEFPGGSVILTGSFDGAKYFAGSEGDDGSKSNPDATIIVKEEGLLTNTIELTASSGSTCSNSDFNPEKYAELYAELAETQEENGGTLRYSPNTTEGPKTGVVNMTGYWGNKTKTVAKMIEYIEEAAKEGVELLVFPETVLSGYGWVTPDKDPFYQKYGVSMQVYTAETVPGTTTNLLSEYAKKYNMYIIFGMTEKDEAGPIYETDSDGNQVEKVYNSAAILYPDGTIDSYQKIHRAGLESRWSVCGDTPKMIDTEWGKIGIDICRDGHFYPELGRYYAASGCTMFVHPTATTGNYWYRSTRIGSYTDRDGMAAITCNLLGGDGIYDVDGTFDATDESNIDENGDFVGGSEIPETIYNQNEVENDPYWDSSNWIGTGGVFNSTSLIISKGSVSTGNRLNYNGTGHTSEGFEERGNTSPLGLEIADLDLKGTGFNGTSQTFRAELFSRMYDKLAQLYREGYESLYDEDILEPITVDLTVDEPTTEETTTEAPATDKTTTTTAPQTSSETKNVTIAKAKIKSAKNSKKKSIVVKFNKLKNAKKYQIKYSTKKSFKNAKVKTVAKTTYTIKKLKKGKTYYVKVRGINGKVVGKWSKAKKIKIKK